MSTIGCCTRSSDSLLCECLCISGWVKSDHVDVWVKIEFHAGQSLGIQTVWIHFTVICLHAVRGAALVEYFTVAFARLC